MGTIDVRLEEIKDFKQVVAMFNNDLHSKGMFDLEYMLINNSVEDVIKVLELNCYYYTIIKNDMYNNQATFSELLEYYFHLVKNYYNSLYIIDGRNDRVADRYYDKLREPVKDSGSFIQYPKESIGMIKVEVEKTLSLMREAIQAYYKVYHNKQLVAELSTNTINRSDYLEFTIKEGQLLHLLGVTANQLRDNPDFIRLTGNRYMNSVQILEWIMRDLEGNNDLMQYADDMLSKISNSSFELSNEQFARETQTKLLNYHKVKTKSQAFLKYGPFEKVSLVAKLQDGKKLAVNSNSNTAIISRAECFRKYPWAYFGSVQNPNDKYIETLLIDTPEGKREVLRGSSPAVIKGVFPGEAGSEGGRIFSEDEQFNIFCEAYDAFRDVMDFKDLISYFDELADARSINGPIR